MRDRRPRISVALLILTMGLMAAAAVSVYLQHRAGIRRYGHGYVAVAVPAIWTFEFAAIGALILRRQPGNRIGWVFSAIGVSWGVSIFAGEYARYALLAHAAPFGTVAAWIDSNFFIVPLALQASFLLMWFPDGELPSRRWKPLPWVAAGGIALGLARAAAGARSPGDYPWHLPWRATGALALLANVAEIASGVVVLGAIVASVVALVVRYRRTAGEERQRLRVFVWGAAIGGVLVVLSIPSWDVSRLFAFVAEVSAFVLVPIAAAVSILRYRLYDVEVVVNKAVVYATLAAFITMLYVGIVVGIGRVIGNEGNAALSIGATALVAVAFQPVRDAVKRLANRIVYGKRATPYEVVAGFSRRVSGTLSIDQLLPEMAESVARGLGATWSRVRVFIPGGDDLTVTWPADVDGREPERSIAVTFQGDPIGEIGISKTDGEGLTPAEEDLLRDLGSQAGLAFHNVRLTTQLEARLEELSEQTAALQESRQRLVTARDAQRRSLERDVREGPERQLTAISRRIVAASELIDRDPQEAEEMLERIGTQATATLEELRDLARGVFPPLLAEKGVVAALEAHVRKVGARAEIEATHAFRSARFAPDVEACLYFCCLQAIQNVIRHAANAPAVVRLDVQGGEVSFAVVDGGPGFDVGGTPQGMGLQIIKDRMDALEGSLEVRSAPGGGTTVTGRIPVGVGVAAG